MTRVKRRHDANQFLTDTKTEIEQSETLKCLSKVVTERVKRQVVKRGGGGGDGGGGGVQWHAADSTMETFQFFLQDSVHAYCHSNLLFIYRMCFYSAVKTLIITSVLTGEIVYTPHRHANISAGHTRANPGQCVTLSVGIPSRQRIRLNHFVPATVYHLSHVVHRVKYEGNSRQIRAHV